MPMNTTDAPATNPMLPPTPTAPRLYSVEQIAIATALTTFVCGGALAALNFRALGQKQKAWQVLLGGLILSVFVFVLANLLSVGWQVSGGTLMAVGYFSAKQLATQWFGLEFQRGAVLRSSWSAAGIVLVAFACFAVALTFGIIVAGEIGPKSVREWANDEVEMTEHAKVGFSGDATANDARRLGEALQSVGFLDGEGEISVQLSIKAKKWHVCFLVAEGVWNEPDTVDAFREMLVQVKKRVQIDSAALCDANMEQRAVVPVGP